MLSEIENLKKEIQNLNASFSERECKHNDEIKVLINEIEAKKKYIINLILKKYYFLSIKRELNRINAKIVTDEKRSVEMKK